MSAPAAAFYCVTGRDFFPGAAAMVNSLRLLGHDEPIYVLDCGLEPRQRELLATETTLLPAPAEGAPSLMKLVAPQTHPAEVMVLLDADLIATRPLNELIERAATGAVVAFENDTHRHFPEWGELLDLGTVPPGPYVTSSAVIVGREQAAELLPVMESVQMSVPRERTWLAGGPADDPLYFLDQDVLNAVARARLAPEQLVALEGRLAPIPPFAGLRLRDEATLRCGYRDGTEPYLLHHAFRKPWLVGVRTNVYSRLLTRLLLAPDVAIRLDGGQLPLRLRAGAAARGARLATDLVLALPGAARRLRRRPSRVTAWPNSAAR